MSTHDPFGPLRPGIGPDLIQNDLDVRPDVRFQSEPIVEVGFKTKITLIFRFVAGTIMAAVVLTFLLFLPGLIGELRAIDSVTAQGQTVPAAQFVEKLQSIFVGALIVASSLVALLASAAMAAGDPVVRRLDRAREHSRGRSMDPMLNALTEVRNV